MKNNSPRKKSAPLNDAELEQWLADVLDAPASKRASRDPQTKAILSMVDGVRNTLVPIQPSPRFVRDLGYRLVDTASRGQQPLIRRYRTAIVIGVAAAGSLASAVGVAAILLHQKNRRAARSV
jgi:hypothetical protein